MRITKSHVDLWMIKRGPKWMGQWEGRYPDINGMINAKVRRRAPEYELAAGNLIAILKEMRKRGDLIRGLWRMSRDPGTLISPARRKANCIKWLRKIGELE